MMLNMWTPEPLIQSIIAVIMKFLPGDQANSRAFCGRAHGRGQRAQIVARSEGAWRAVRHVGTVGGLVVGAWQPVGGSGTAFTLSFSCT
jgi:hypothetical protein